MKSTRSNLEYRNVKPANAKSYIMAVLIGLLIVMGTSVLALAQSGEDIPMRAKRETLGIHFDGVKLSENSDARRLLSEKMAYRFDPAPDRGTYNMYINAFTKKKTSSSGKVSTSHHFEVRLQLPSGTTETIYDCKINFLPSDKHVLQIFNESFGEIKEGIVKHAPVSSRIVEVNGGMVYVDMGSEVGLSRGDRLEVFNPGGGKVGLLKVLNVNEGETEAKILRGGNLMPGYRVSARPVLLGGVGLDYTHFTVTDDEGEHQGRQAMLVFNYIPQWSRQAGGWFSLQVGAGIMDVWNERGVHVADVDLIASLEVLADLLFIDVGGGGGVTAYGYKVESGDSTKTIIQGIYSYKGFGGLRLHLARDFSLNFRVEYLDYTKFESPDQPAYRFGLMGYIK